MNVWRRMVPKIHQDAAIREWLQSRHKRKSRATIALQHHRDLYAYFGRAYRHSKLSSNSQRLSRNLASYSKALKVAGLYATMKQRKAMMELLTPRA